MNLGFRPASKREPCPVCASIESSCSLTSDPDFVFCHNATNDSGEWKYSGEASNGFQSYFNRVDLNRYPSRSKEEWERVKAERVASAERKRQDWLSKCGESLNEEDRSAENRKLLGNLTLNPAHRANLLNRGLKNAEISYWGFKSVTPNQELAKPVSPRLAGIDRTGKKVAIREPGFLCPIPSVSGLTLGFQLRADNPTNGKYKWLLSQNSSHLNNGELPIGVYRLPNLEPTRIVFCEGYLKPAIAASLSSGDIYVGAFGGNFPGSPLQVQSVLTELRKLYPQATVCFAPDAGSLKNHSVRSRDTKTLNLLASLLGQSTSLKVLWWEQGTDKATGDIDEFLKTGRKPKEIDLSAYRSKIRHWDDVSEHEKQNRYSRRIDRDLNQSDIGDLPFPEFGKITAVSSPCKTGKTTAIENWVNSHASLYPHSKVYLLGYRNALLEQTCNRIGGEIEHIHDLQEEGLKGKTATYVNSRRGVALCLDSLQKLEIEKIQPNSLILLDEGEAVIKHLLEGGTMGRDHAKIAHYFRRFCQRVMELGGAIAVLEDNLTDLSLDFLSELLLDKKHTVHFVRNSYQASKWDVTIFRGQVSGFVSRLAERAVVGTKIFLPTTSQVFGEKVEAILAKLAPHLKVFRIDRDTMAADLTKADCHEAIANPDTKLAAINADVVIGSPTIESGLSIWADLFDEVWAYCVNLEVRAQIQLLERYRLEKPRFVYVADRLAGGETRSGQLQKYWNRSILETVKLAGFESQDFTQLLEESKFWNRHAANFKARESLSLATMGASLILNLEKRGHNIRVEQVARSEVMADLLKVVKEEIEYRKAEKLNLANPGNLTAKEAPYVLKDPSATPEMRLAAEKVLLQERVPGMDLTADCIRKIYIAKRGNFLKSTEDWWHSINTEVAQVLDRRSVKSALEGTQTESADPVLFGHRFRHYRQKANLVEKLDGLRQLIEADGEYRETDEIVIELAKSAYLHRDDFRRLFGLQIGNPDGENRSHSAIATVNKICKRFGFKAVVDRKEGKRGQQIRVWKFDPGDREYRAQILEAIARRYQSLTEETEETEHQETVEATKNEVVAEVSTTQVDPDIAQPQRSWKGLVGRISEDVSRAYQIAWYGRGQLVRVISEDFRSPLNPNKPVVEVEFLEGNDTCFLPVEKLVLS